jgi:2-oxoisovalerate dehydrogenase E1 component
VIEARGRAAELAEDELLRIYDLMLTGRILETRLRDMARDGHVPGVLFPGVGQEAAMVGLAFVLDENDVYAGSHRNLTALLARGVTVEQVLLNVLGKAASPTGGRSEGFGVAEPGSLMIEPAGPPNHQVAVGCAVAFAARREARVVLADCGEGATAEGAWHEAVNVAAVHRLPMVFTVQTNGFAGPQRSAGVSALEYVAHRADGYGIPGVVVDGTDVLECIAAAGEAIEQARFGGGPSVIEAVTFRRFGHTAVERDGPADPDERAAWEGRDPIDRFEEYLGVRGLLDEARRAATRNRIAHRVEDSIGWARDQDEPDRDTLAAGVLAERSPVSEAGVFSETGDMTMRAALHDALDAEMARDERVVLMGRDVAAGGGSHGVTAGLLERYGPTRLFDIPGSAAAVMGAGIGAALEGMRPVVEIPDARRVPEALGLLAGWAARHHWTTGRPVPLVLRVPYGPDAEPRPDVILPGIPGLRVVAASTPATAASLLVGAIRDPNPVVVLEPIRCYDEHGPVPGGDAETPPAAARVIRSGDDVTMVAWGSGVSVALEACRLLEDVSVELIDVLSLAPLDWSTVMGSIGRTSRLVVLEERSPFGGVGSELAALAAAEAMWDLDAPVVRLAAATAQVPFTPLLADAYLLTPVEVAEAVRSITST